MQKEPIRVFSPRKHERASLLNIWVLDTELSRFVDDPVVRIKINPYGDSYSPLGNWEMSLEMSKEDTSLLIDYLKEALEELKH